MILVNGTPRGELSAMDRGLAYGDGVFRTFRARCGRALHWQRHYAKLAHDCAALAIDSPPAEVLEADIATACGAEAERVVKIIITRGESERGYAYSGSVRTTRIVGAVGTGLYPAANASAGVRVRLCSLRLSHQPALAGLKHLNRLENVLARAEWSDAAISEGILLDCEERVIGGTMSNVFLVVNGALITPTLDRCGVAGVTRERVIDAATGLGVVCSVASVSWTDVLSADEVFVVNSVAGVWPIRDLEGHQRTPGPVTGSIQRALQKDDDAQVA